MAAALAIPAIGGIVSNVVGGLLGQASGSSGDQIAVSNSTGSNQAINSALFDAAGRIGFADISSLRNSGPIARLTQQIMAMPIENRMKRRALAAISEMQKSGGTVSSTDKLEIALGRKGGADTSTISGQNIKALEGVMARLGITLETINATFGDQARYDEQLAELGDIGSFQPDVIRDRLEASAGVSDLAAGLVGGDSVLQDRFRNQFLKDRFNSLDDQQESLLLQGQFGGFNPGVGLEQIEELRADARFDAELKSLEQALFVGTGVNNLLNPGTASSLAAGGLSADANNGALGIAASQATAANALLQGLNINNSDSAAAGASGAITGLFDTIGAFAPAGD